MQDFRHIILNAAQEEGLFAKETERSLIIKCPSCGRKKLYFDKNVGYYKCFSGKCQDSGSVVKLLANIKNIPFSQAKDAIFFQKKHHIEDEIKVDFSDATYGFVKPDLFPIEKEPHFLSLRDLESVEGRYYLLNRGIPTVIAEKYGISYSSVLRRVIFPVNNENGELMAYQGRAIDNVDKAARMRNNTNSHKSYFLMFYDLAKDSDHLIVAEGPVDAIKFDMCGGNIASMGKDLSVAQLNIIANSKATKIYWALDDDANNLLPEYISATGKENYVVKLTEEARSRILSTGKTKADFGECTFDECLQAFKNAECVDNKIFLAWE